MLKKKCSWPDCILFHQDAGENNGRGGQNHSGIGMGIGSRSNPVQLLSTPRKHRELKFSSDGAYGR